MPGQEGDQSSPPTAEVKNEWSYTSTPSHGVIARTGITLPLACYLKQNTQNLHSKDLSVNDVYNLKVLDFKLSPCFICNVFSFGYLPGVRVLKADVSEFSVGSIFIGRSMTCL